MLQATQDFTDIFTLKTIKKDSVVESPIAEELIKQGLVKEVKDTTIVNNNKDKGTGTDDTNGANTGANTELSYAEMKELATAKGLTFKHNISTVNLRKLLEDNKQ